MTAHKTWIEVSKQALIHNFEQFHRIADGSDVMPVIKGNAYGHGLIPVANALHEAGVRWFAVDNIHEAQALRQAGFKQRILVLGFVPREAIETAIAEECSFVLFNEGQLSYIEARRRVRQSHGPGGGEGKARIHVPVETGLYREGFEPDAFKDILERTRSNAGILLEGVQMHFANVEDTVSGEYADRQLNEYKKYIELIDEYNIGSIIKHTAASAASILYSTSHFDMIRPGVSLYGFWPSLDTKRRAAELHPEFMLKPALTWKTTIAQLKQVKAGERIGYGLTEMLERDSSIAILPIGYYDGYDRVGMSSKAHVLVRGNRCKIIGRICMNMCMIDVTDISEVKEGDEVVLLGAQGEEEVSAEELAEHMGTINYEVVSRLGAHIPRVLI